jgi:rhamnulokinase
MQEAARVAIDLGAESCRVSLLRWMSGRPSIEVIHRIPNGPVHHPKDESSSSGTPVRRGDCLCWPLTRILAGLEEGLRKAAAAAPEGIRSIGVDGWSVDYVRLAPDGTMLREPFCYRDERTTATKEAADRIISPLDLYQRTGTYPLKINTVYQLLADPAAGIDNRAPWVMLPEFVLYWLSGRRAAEYTNATHTGLVNLKTGDWDAELFRLLGMPLEAAPEMVATGTVLGPLTGELAQLDAFRATQIIAPATHDTASAIAGIPNDLSSAAYISSGTWSLVGTITQNSVTTRHAFDAGYTNIGAAAGGLLFHSLINSMWVLKQCLDAWAAEGRAWPIENLIQEAAARSAAGGVLDMDAETLMLDSKMPQRINNELSRLGFDAIPDVAGNEPLFARTIFESLALRYASATANLEKMLGCKLDRIHMIGGATRNKLLVELTEQRTGLPVEIGETESSTVGNLAVQLAASEAEGERVTPAAIREWATRLCQPQKMLIGGT